MMEGVVAGFPRDGNNVAEPRWNGLRIVTHDLHKEVGESKTTQLL